jgi:hypothetical protein
MQLISPFVVIICNQTMINAEIYFNAFLLQYNFFFSDVKKVVKTLILLDLKFKDFLRTSEKTFIET